MKTSVIIPCYKADPHLPAAIRSVQSQSLPAQHQLEIIFVLDGPAPGARDLIQAHSPESRIVELPHNRGPSAARNAGLQVASGDYITFLDADDLWPTGKLLRELFLVEQPGLQGVTWQAVFGLNQKF
ncbi:MAG: glycosyltransferase family 2 protein, partial [Verrucomicrobiales bacterium]